MIKLQDSCSRRDLLRGLFGKAPAERQKPVAAPAENRVAVIQGRFCLAYQNSFCSTCVERCPISGAIEVTNGIPRVNLDLCNGCSICQQVCPAPRNAILLINKRGRTGALPVQPGALRANLSTHHD